MMMRWALVTVAVWMTGAVHAEALVPYCAAAAMQVYALPPAASVGGHGHLLVMEARNAGAVPCLLAGPGVDLEPQEDGVRITDGPQRGEESDLAQGNAALTVGAWAHFVVVWMDVGVPEVPCQEHSTLKLRFGGEFPGDPLEWVEVRNLWMHSCLAAFVSGWRKGHFAGNVRTSKEWMDVRAPLAAQEVLFPGQVRWDQISSVAEGFEVHTRTTRTMLGDNVGVEIRFPRGTDGGCAYRLVRKRESNGATIVELQNCPENTSAKLAEAIPYTQPGLTGISTRNEHLNAEHVGAVTYDVLAQVGSAPNPRFVMQGVTLRVADPAQPKMPELVSNVDSCRMEQLKFAASAMEQPEKLVHLRAYTATNVSAAECSLEGVPQVTLEEEDGTPGRALPKACPNCTNPAYAPRPAGRIDLMPGQSAHVVVAGTQMDTVKEHWTFCSPLFTKFELQWNGEAKMVMLPFGANVCDAVDVSAWRSGPYDGDPKNVEWAKAHRADVSVPEEAVPDDCKRWVHDGEGAPHMVETEGTLALGWSMEHDTFSVGDHVMLHLWADNAGDKPQGFSSCRATQKMAFRGFRIYDAYGHLLKDKGTAWGCGDVTLMPSMRCHPRVDDIEILAHTCVHAGGTGVSLELPGGHDLPPGRYIVALDDVPGRDRCKVEDVPFVPKAGMDLTFDVVAP